MLLISRERLEQMWSKGTQNWNSNTGRMGINGEKGKGKGGKGDAPTSKLTMVEKMRLKRRRRRKGDGEKPDGEKEKREGGPDLPRERVTEVPVTGEVVEWKGKYGWLKPHEEVKHDLAENHGGKLYVHEKDVLDGAPLSAGQTVEFHIYADKTGLGAEEAIATS
uniref:CSD domain-containing protein n=1 Tax=Alexandrium monilatum TaxID=311494 RepID=A0A7S4RST7_9DINO